MAQLASLKFKDPGFIMRMHRGLTLEMTNMVWPTKYVVSSGQQRQELDTFLDGVYRDSAPNRVLLR